MQRTKRLKLKDKSTLSKGAYIFDHVSFGAFLGYDLVKIVLPCLVPITYFDQSLVKMAICLIMTSLFGIAFSFANNRTGKGVIIDILSGLGIYTGLVLGKYVPGFMRFVFVVTVMITLVSLVFIVFRKIKVQSKRKQIIFGRFIRSTQLVRRNIGVACAAVLFIVPVTLHFGNNKQLSEDYDSKMEAYVLEGVDATQYETEPLEVNEIYGDEYRLSKNLDTIKLIKDDDVFQKLSYEEKCEVVTAILRCEGRYLGLEEFDIEFKELAVSTLGRFDYRERTITINSMQLKDGSLPGGSADAVLYTCLHECRHYYQHLMIDLYANATPEQRNLYAFTGEGVAAWYENMGNYHGVYSDDVGEYYDYVAQPLEIDASEYALEQSRLYYLTIDKMLGKQTN